MKQTSNNHIVKKTALGAGIALLVYLALLALLSLLVVRGTVGEGGVGACVWVFAAFAAFAGAKAAAWRAPKSLSLIAGCAAVFWLLILLLGFLVNDGIDATRSATLALPILAGGAAAYLLRGGKKRGKRKRRSHK